MFAAFFVLLFLQIMYSLMYKGCSLDYLLFVYKEVSWERDSRLISHVTKKVFVYFSYTFLHVTYIVRLYFVWLSVLGSKK